MHPYTLNKTTPSPSLVKLYIHQYSIIVNESSEGPAYFTIEDPDGNPILLDQHR
jgi:hypothetical protein